MAEWICSGIPLSTSSLTGQPFVLTRGFTTEEVLDRAIALFDSAVVLAADSTRIRYLAQVGKGRALLDVGRFTEAAAAVAEVPTQYRYSFEFNSSTSTPGSNYLGEVATRMQVRDNEGVNGSGLVDGSPGGDYDGPEYHRNPADSG